MPARPTAAAAHNTHSPAWVAQVWISWTLAFGCMLLGIWFLPSDVWVKGFLAMGLVFSVGSSFSLAKTLRDVHESDRLVARIDDARLEKMLSEHDPLKPAL